MKLRFILLFIFFTTKIVAQLPEKDKFVVDTLWTTSDLFRMDKPLNIVLKSDFKNFKKNKNKGIQQDAELSYYFHDSIVIKKKIKIKARGHNRLENCYFPPIKLIFKNPNDTGTFNFNSLKMVVQCRDIPNYEIYLLKEFLCYKLYNCLSDTSFRVRLVNLAYVDNGTRKTTEKSVSAFLIEDEKSMAKRLNMSIDKREKLTQKYINQNNIIRLALFEFMIGNFDWGVPTQRNIRILISRQENPSLHCVPYDFDYCGLVNAEYAVPNALVGVNSVKERIYLGECKPLEDFYPFIELFKFKKEDFYKTISNFEYINEREKKQMILYLDEFYEILQSKGFYSNYIRKACKEIK